MHLLDNLELSEHWKIENISKFGIDMTVEKGASKLGQINKMLLVPVPDQEERVSEHPLWARIFKLRIHCLKMGSMSSNIHQNVGNWTRKKLDFRFENFCSTLFAFENGLNFRDFLLFASHPIFAH